MTRYSHLNGCFWLFSLKFWEVAGTNKWYFVIVWMQVQWWRYHEMVGTLKPCLLQKILFELFAFTGRGDTKTLGTSARARTTWWNFHYFYRPQRSWAKVMFLQGSVILLTGGVSASVQAGIHPPRAGTPPKTRNTPQGRYTTQDQVHPPPPGPGTPPRAGTPPKGMYPPWDQVHPPKTRYIHQDQVHPPKYGQWVTSTHPTGMHSCF